MRQISVIEDGRTQTTLALPSVQEFLREGEHLLQAHQFQEALERFESAQGREPDNREASMGANLALRGLIPRWHFAMLNDMERNYAFEEALREAVTPTTLVLDIGAGSGLLAMLAARSGAPYIVSCEAIRPMAQLASEIVTANGFMERIQIIPRVSLDLKIGRDLPRKADLLVTEIFDCGLLGEAIIPTIRHARQYLLRDGGRMIPQTARVFAALLESEQVHKLNNIQDVCGFNLSLFNRFSTLGYFPVRLNTWCHQMLTEPQEIFSFDFLRDSLLPAERCIDFTVTYDGQCHGIVFWFEVDLNDHVSISNNPYNPTTHWMQAVQCLLYPVEVTAGQVVSVTAAHDDTSTWFNLNS